MAEEVLAGRLHHAHPLPAKTRHDALNVDGSLGGGGILQVEVLQSPQDDVYGADLRIPARRAVRIPACRDHTSGRRNSG